MLKAVEIVRCMCNSSVLLTFVMSLSKNRVNLSGTSKEKEKTSPPSIVDVLVRQKESFPRPKSSTNQTADMLQYNAFITYLKKKNFCGLGFIFM